MKAPGKLCLWLWLLVAPALASAQSSVTVRVMAANLNGNTQSYQPFALRIFQGLAPDVVCIQEFNYSNNTPADFRAMLDAAFGTNFVYYREPYTNSGGIPNGIISRYPILAAGSWTDTVQSQPNRGFAWAQIDLPGTNDLYAVSVHLLTSSAANRATEAANLKALMQANFPADAWVVVAGDFNAGSRTEACVTTFSGYLADFPVPVDKNGNSDTSANRTEPHDYVLAGVNFTNRETATVCGPLSYPSGLVFDSRVYSANELLNFSPVQAADSGLAQHMAVVKDFSLTGDVPPATNPPVITAGPLGQTNAAGVSVTFSVTATGGGALNYQWRFADTNLSGATTNPFVLPNAQPGDSGGYAVVVTNAFGSVTSSVAMLLITNASPSGPAPTNAVISQIYGGGGFTAASFQNDFVELFNPGSTTVSLANWSLQYASYTGTTWNALNLTGTISPWHYYLVKLGSDGTAGNVLPTADVTGSVNLSASRGKIALVSSQTALTGANPVGGATVVDFVGYGAANAFEGSGPATGGNNTTSVLRRNGGYTDANDNTNDFTTLTPPAPRNSGAPANPPSAPPAASPVLSATLLGGGQLQLTLTGTAGTNYIVLFATNLPAAAWTPLVTNAAPFSLIETNPPAPHRFYRAVAQ